MSVPSLRVRITGTPSAGAARGGAPPRRTLSLTAEELDRLPVRLPIELFVKASGDSDGERLRQQLQRDGLTATVEPASASYGACAQHAKLLESDICPRCDARACAACVRLAPQIACARCRTRQRRWTTFRRVRIGALLAVLAGVASATSLDRARIASWSAPLEVVVHPIAGDESPAVAAYLAQLDPASLEPVATFLDAEARRYGRTIAPAAVIVTLGKPLDEPPPAIPDDAGAFDAITWSLHFRAWAALTARRHDLRDADVRLFLVFHEAIAGRTIQHSTGLEKGRIGAVTLFGAVDAERFNAVVLAHELLRDRSPKPG